MQTNILVLNHHPPGFKTIRNIEVLLGIECRSGQRLTKLCFGLVFDERNTVHGTNIDAGIAFDTKVVGEHRLNVAVQAALSLLSGKLGVESKLNLHLKIVQR